FFPTDFSPKKNHPEAQGSTLPEQWPISYADMQPYYEHAERLFRLRGSTDTCHPGLQTPHFLTPPPLCSATQELNDFFTDNGLHPYRLPQACEFVPGCQGCQGFLCPNNCKNDSVRICLLPAIEKYNACLLEECEVIKLESDQNSVTSVICDQHGKKIVLRGTTIILAAGALETPRLLLKSNTKQWPNGLANDSGLVGRNLMRHYVDLYALLPPSQQGHPGNLKELAFNDFYQFNGHKFGTVQSFGALPPPAVIIDGMEKDLRDEGRNGLAALFKIGKPLIRPVLKHIFSRRILFASIMEDLPYLDNRVTLSNTTHDRLSIQYKIRPHEQNRIQLFRDQLAKAFSANRFMLIKQAENNERIAHACGTCRFGLEPENSVLNMNNRAHGLENLYIVDSSFFPSSAGTNPSLTLAANALRVAEQIA
ncbi:MAG TPA: GMC family oxidoreductase, partial [Candidatus Tenderia electrophaga]|nr:GMC family oxidoreductase [Candidatus Tenderia electrophaga]